MNENSWIARIDRHGPALVALAIALAALAYLADAANASTRLHNMILLVPLVGFAVIMAIGITLMHFKNGPEPRPVEDDSEIPEGTVSLPPLNIAIMMAALVLYACVAPYIGFDVASAIFIGLCLYIQGDRRWHFIVIYSVLFSAAITWSLAHLAGAAVPTLII